MNISSTRKQYLFYSMKDPKSLELFETIDIPWDKYFYSICVDKKQVRDILKNSKNIKINKVPCLLVVDNEGEVAKYEDSGNKEIVRMWIEKNLLGKVKPLQQSQHQQPQHQQPPQQPQHQPPQQPRQQKLPESGLGLQSGNQPGFQEGKQQEGFTMLDLGDSPSPPPVTQKQNGQNVTLIDADEPDFRKSTDRKVPSIEEGYGHQSMARSSLTDSGSDLPKKEKDVVMKSLLQKAKEMRESHELDLSQRNTMLS